MNNQNSDFKSNVHQDHIDSVIDILEKNKFTFSVEIIPPRNGTDFLDVFSIIEKLQQAEFDFISVTHGAGGSLRGGTLPIAYHAQNAYNLTAIAHLTCRGSTQEDLENMLIDHHYFGIHNILALRGDPPDGINSDFKKPDGGFEYAYELIKLISQMNQGKYSKRAGFDEDKEYREGMKTRFCIGVACYPEDSPETRLQYLKAKIDSGADFGITQIVLNEDIFFSYHEQVAEFYQEKFPILPGIRIPGSFKQLQRMRDKFGISVSDELWNSMEKQTSKEDMLKVGIEWSMKFIDKLKSKNVPGVHFFIMGDPSAAINVKNNSMINLIGDHE